MLNLTRTTTVIFFSVIAVSSYTACSGGEADQGTVPQAFTGVPDAGSETDATTTSSDASMSDAGDGSTSSCMPAPSISVCSDGQIVAILHASNQGEILIANSLVNRLVNADAKSFAQLMITDHTKSDTALMSTAQMAGIAVVENGLSTEISDSAKDDVQKFSSMSGDALDRAYMQDAVLDHLKDLGMGEHLLAPSAKNPQIMSAVQSAHAIIATHEQVAINVLGSLEGACGGSTSTP